MDSLNSVNRFASNIHTAPVTISAAPQEPAQVKDGISLGSPADQGTASLQDLKQLVGTGTPAAPKETNFKTKDELINSLLNRWQQDETKVSGAEATGINNLRQLQQSNAADAVSAQLTPGTAGYWVWQARHMTDFFANVSVDRENGGFYTNIDSKGQVTDTEKFLMPTSRQVYSYATTYDMTGDRKNLDLAHHGIEFMLKNNMRMTENGEIYWIQHTAKDGTPAEGEEAKPLNINEQTYAMTGLIATYKATRDPELLQVIHKTHDYITNHFHDDKNGGFFNSVDPTTLQPDHRKSYNSVVYPATSALLELATIADGAWGEQVKGQVKELADIFVKNFPDQKTGFIKENFTEDWKEDWTGWQKQPEGSIGVAGHNTQGALFLMRAEKLLGGENTEYTKTAQTLMDSMLDKAYDREHGGFGDVFVRETGKNMWHTNKAFWQQEEGYLAALALSGKSSDPKYAQAADKTLNFWDNYFIDRQIGGDRMTVAADGTPVEDPKGGPGKSSYHAVEMARLAMDITDPDPNKRIV